MNSVWERELAACRARLASDPDAAAVWAARLVMTARTNGERLRAKLTLAGVDKAKGRLEAWRQTLEDAERYRRPGPLARSELAGRWAQFHLYQADLGSAAVAADRAVRLAEPLALAAPANRPTYSAASVVPRAAYAAALVTRAEVRLHGASLSEALSDAFAALSWADPRFSSHVHFAGLTILGAILVRPGIATPAFAHEVLKICRQAHRILGARRIKARDPHRIGIRGLEALALAVFGSVERAETLLVRTVQEFKDAGRERDALIFAKHIVWLVGYRAGQSGRARNLALRYGLPASEDANPLPPPKPEDDDEPIGF